MHSGGLSESELAFRPSISSKGPFLSRALKVAVQDEG